MAAGNEFKGGLGWELISCCVVCVVCGMMIATPPNLQSTPLPPQNAILLTAYADLPADVREAMYGVRDGVYIASIDPESDLSWRFGLHPHDRVR